MAKTVKELMHVEKSWDHGVIRGQLGLTQDYLEAVTGRVLDFGCGDASFVRHLRNLGIEAEGVDIQVDEEGEYLMESFVDAPEAIPRPDGHYQLIIANSVPGIYLNNRAMRARHASMGEGVCEVQRTAQGAMQEILRLLDPACGRFVSYPGLSDVDESLENMITQAGFTHSVELTPATPTHLRFPLLLKYLHRRLSGEPIPLRDANEIFFYRSVITPVGYQSDF